MARRRQEIIAKLKQEGVFDLQKELSLPLFCLHIAVISSTTAAGYGDFCNQLADSPFAFRTQLFPAIMQGEQVETSIIAALERIYSECSESENSEYSEYSESSEKKLPFDCVVIIRGGGATSDMSGFDTLALAENVVQFPLPIITGIGHDRDECILDMVSHTRVKTPTAAAAFLIDHAQSVLNRIEDCENRIVSSAQSHMLMLSSRLDLLSQRIPILFSLAKTQHEARIRQLTSQMESVLSACLERQMTCINTLKTQLSIQIDHILLTKRHRLELLSQRAASLDPQLLLKRGYSITLFNGKAVRNAKSLKQGNEIETRLEKGTIKSIIK